MVCYTDSTIALPLITAYALSKVTPRPRKRLYERRDAMLEKLRQQYLKSGTVGKIEHRTDLKKPARPRTGRTAGASARKGKP